MTEQEARDTMKQCKWSFLKRERSGLTYVYAARHVKGKREEKYIGSLSSLARLTAEDLKATLGCA